MCTDTLRALLTIAAAKDMDLVHWDVSTAFLNARLEEDIFCKIPDGFPNAGSNTHCWKLNRALYGLKQAPAAWHREFKQTLKSIGFVQSAIDPCVYRLTQGKNSILMGVFVDDICVATTSTKFAQGIYDQLASKYKMSNLGELTYFTGVSISRNRQKRTIFLHQPKYTEEILERFNMHMSCAKHTPLPSGLQLQKVKEDDYTWPVDHEDYSGPYRQKVGSLLYLAIVSRPDIAQAVSYVAQFNSAPTKAADKAVNHIFKYLNGTRDFGITLGPDIGPLHTFADAAHQTEGNMQAVTGYMIRMGNSPIMWQSKKQVLTTLSTMESELDALASATIPSIWLRDLLNELIGFDNSTPITILQDNAGTIAHVKNEQTSNRTAHLRRRYNFLHQYCELGWIELKHLPGTEMVADHFTKALPRAIFEYHCKHFMSVSDPDQNPFELPKFVPELQKQLGAKTKSTNTAPPKQIEHLAVAICNLFSVLLCT